MKTATILLTCLLGLAGVTSGATMWSASLIPSSGSIFAPPGQKAGWGYSISNHDMAQWLVPFNLDADTFEHGSANSLFLFPAVAPGSTITVPWDGVSGLYELHWDADAPLGFVNLGVFVISADFYTGDPASGGVFSSVGGQEGLAYSIEASGIPEPGTAAFVISSMFLFALAAKKRGRRAP